MRPAAEDALAYVASSYPHNHDYRVVGGELRPRFKLWRRWRRIRRLYPAPLESLLDLSSSKGFFVLEAAGRPGCARALGVDVHAPDVAAAGAVAEYARRDRARFELARLDELAARVDELGGPFQTVLLINTYPYLYFGSRREPRGYLDHERMFAWMARLTRERLVFSNRVDLARLPRHVREDAAARGLGGGYTEAAIRAAASPHFALEERGRLGRIPLWLLHRR